MALGENTFVFMSSKLDLRLRTLAHEIGHALDNDFDKPNPQHIFYPADSTYYDNDVESYRRITSATAQKCRTVRQTGKMNASGNRLLKTK